MWRVVKIAHGSIIRKCYDFSLNNVKEKVCICDFS